MMGEASNVAMRRRVIWSATIGNALEWFDFVVFSSFTGIIGALFFPKSNATAAVLAGYGLLAVAYIARPIGGLFFGIWADRVGRKRALVTIVLSMAVGTAMIGLVPTYDQIGVAAPLLLLVARLIQGFSAGGEFGTSTAMLIEFAPPGRRGFYASFQFVAQALAFACGAACAFILNAKLSPEALQSWGWRLPFLAGIIIGPVGFYLRRAVDETPEFKSFAARHTAMANTPLRDVLVKHPRALIALLLMIAGLTTNTYVGIAYMPNFVTSEFGLKMADAQLGVLVLNVVSVFLLPVTGLLSDRIGRRRTMTPAIIIYLVVLFFLMQNLIAAPSNAAVWTMQAAGIIILFATGPGCALTLELFPVNVRSTGASIVYNFAVAVFGGVAPLIIGWIFKLTADKMAPFYCLLASFVLTLIGLAILPKRKDAQAAA